jgi:hypothetical protein
VALIKKVIVVVEILINLQKSLKNLRNYSCILMQKVVGNDMSGKNPPPPPPNNNFGKRNINL